jgi:GNAT superfamily N-acetyltransferase
VQEESPDRCTSRAPSPLPAALRVEDEPSPADVAALHERLYRYNAAVTGCDDGRWLTILLRDEGGEIHAGLHGWTWGRTGFVDTLWIREDLRGRGLGARLLATAEAEATRRGCREMHLNTHSYQAPGFYRRLGYEVIAELPGWPRESTRIFLRKPLLDPPVGQ